MEVLKTPTLFGLLLAIAALIFLSAGVRALRLGLKTIYFRHRRQRILAGWWLNGAALLLVVLAALVFKADLPAFPALRPAATAPPSLVVGPSDTVAPSATPSATRRPTQTPQASITPTLLPQLPLSIQIRASSSITPLASAEIFDVRFALKLFGDVYPIGARTEWVNPIRSMYASFAFRNLTPDVQWTALWYRNGQLVFFETRPWDGYRRDRGYSKWEPAPNEWLPGEYEVQFFIGEIWKASGQFTLSGDPMTLTPSRTPTTIPSITPTRTPSFTPTATITRLPTATSQK